MLKDIAFENREECIRKLQTYMTSAFKFMKQYEWMANSYVAEFFIQDFWNKFPLSWRVCFESLSLEEVANLILVNNKEKVYQNVWPLSLLSFISTCHALSLDRTQITFDEESSNLMTQFPKLFTKHIKPKKRHELSILPNIINKVCKQSNSNNVVDIGSGLGHLSRMLAFQYKLNVTAIEMAGQRLPIAEQFDKELEKELRIKNRQADVLNYGCVKHIAKMVDPDITNSEFISLIKNNDKISENNNENSVLVGLHTCGDLASTMVRVFKNTPSVMGLVSVSCCYMRMSLDNKNDTEYAEIDNNTKNETFGFPMSRFVQSIPYQPLKYKSFEVACHFVDDYVRKLQTNSPNLKLHCYRAVMEVFIRHVDPALALSAIRCKKIKNAGQLSFIEYAHKVFERLQLKLDENMLNEIHHERLLEQWKNVAIFHSLVHLLGPVIESIALIDKWIFLLESKLNVSLLPVFDPTVSPRNFILVAVK